MENLNHYFSDAEENISNEFMSANGGEYSDWDDAFDFGGSEEEYLNAMGSADASSSQPYIISLYNSSAWIFPMLRLVVRTTISQRLLAQKLTRKVLSTQWVFQE